MMHKHEKVFAILREDVSASRFGFIISLGSSSKREMKIGVSASVGFVGRFTFKTGSINRWPTQI